LLIKANTFINLERSSKVVVSSNEIEILFSLIYLILILFASNYFIKCLASLTLIETVSK